MNHLQLLDRIKKLDIATIEKMSPEVMARLTDGFDESLVRNVLYIGTTNHVQRRIICTVKNAFRDWKTDTDPYWGNPPLFPERYPQYMEELQMDIECGLVITTEGTTEDVGNKILNTLISSENNVTKRVLDTIKVLGQTGTVGNYEDEEKDNAKQKQHASTSDNDDFETLKIAQDRIKELETEVAMLKMQRNNEDYNTKKESLDYLEEWQQLSTRELAIFFA